MSPSELEGHLLNHPDVADAAVIGVPDDYAGEVPLAFVVLKPPLATKVNEDAELAGDVRDRIDKVCVWRSLIVISKLETDTSLSMSRRSPHVTSG